MLLGAHASVAGGLHNAPPEGDDLGCDVIQIFTRNQRQWNAKPLSDEEVDAFRSAYARSRQQAVVSHASYLINLASPEPDKWKLSRDVFLEEARRSERLGLDGVIVHPGSHLAKGLEAGRQRIAQALRHVLDETQGGRVPLLLETMAGQGTTIGERFQDLGSIIESAGSDARLGVCLDTCHVFAAGNDITTPEGYRSAMRSFDSAIGLDRLKAVHLNDSLKPLGSRVDRHANIGKGAMGAAGFRPLMTDRRLAKVPMTLETLPQGYRQDLATLRSLTKSKRESAAKVRR